MMCLLVQVCAVSENSEKKGKRIFAGFGCVTTGSIRSRTSPWAMGGTPPLRSAWAAWALALHSWFSQLFLGVKESKAVNRTQVDGFEYWLKRTGAKGLRSRGFSGTPGGGYRGFASGIGDGPGRRSETKLHRKPPN